MLHFHLTWPFLMFAWYFFDCNASPLATFCNLFSSTLLGFAFSEGEA